MKYIYFEELNSTNDYLKDNHEKLESNTYCVTYNQTKGRGRSGHTWESEPGKNLSLSVLFKTKELKPNITLKIAKTVYDTIYKLTNLKMDIKWPNDILINNKKLVGILTEGITNDKDISIIIGIGININQKEFKEDLKGKATSLLLELNKEIEIKLIEQELINNLEQELLNYNQELDISFYNKHLYCLNKEVNYYENNNKKRGIIKGVDKDGSLLIETNNILRRVFTGEITIER